MSLLQNKQSKMQTDRVRNLRQISIWKYIYNFKNFLNISTEENRGGINKILYQRHAKDDLRAHEQI